MARSVTHATDATRSTYSATTDYQNKLGIVAWQPAANTDYLVIWRCVLDGSVAGASYRAQLYNESTATSLDEYSYSPDSVTTPADTASAGGFKRLQFGATPSAQTIRIRYKTVTAGNTIGISDAAIYIISMTANDQYAEQIAEVTTTSTSYQVAATLAWTPTGTKDYLIMHDAKIRNSAAGADDAALRFRKGSTTIAEASPIGLRDNSSSLSGLTTFVKQSLSGAQSWTSEYKAVSTGTSRYKFGALCALYLDDFAGVTYDEQAAEVTTASTTAQTAVDIAPTLAATDYLILACGIARNSSATTPTMVALTQDGTALTTEIAREDETGDQHYYPYFSSYYATFTAGSKTFAVRYRNYATDGTARLGSAAIVALQITAVANLRAPDITGTVYLRNTLVYDDIYDLDTGANAATDPASVEIVTAPMHGSATVTGLYINYQPNQGYTGTDSFTYRFTSDSGVVSSTGTAEVVVLPASLRPKARPFLLPPGVGGFGGGAPTLVEAAVEAPTFATTDAPVATDDTVSTEFNTAVELAVLGNDLAGAAPIDPASVNVLNDPAHGTALHSGGGVITYTPDAGFSGQDDFQYEVRDIRGVVSNAATVRINVLEAPVPVTFTNGYGYRTRFRVPKDRHGGVAAMILTYDETKTNFKSVANAGLVQNGTYLDVRVENNSGTQIPHRVVAYNATTGRLRLAILISPTSGVDYGGFIYIGKSGLTATEENVAGVYSGAIDVWNLETGASVISSGRDLTLVGNAAGVQWDDGLTLDGSASYANRSTTLSALSGLSAMTVQIYAKAGAGSVGTDHGLVLYGPSGPGANDRDASFHIRYDATGDRGGASNVIIAGCKTANGSPRIESAASQQNTSAHHYAFTWSSGVLPKLIIDGTATVPTWIGAVSSAGVATADAVVSGNTVAPTTGDLRFGISTKTAATNGFIGELAEASVWSSALSEARIRAEQGSFMYPQRWYGTGQIEAPNVNQGPVAMPVWRNISKNAADLDIDVAAQGGFDADGDTMTLTGRTNGANSTTSIVSGKLRYNVSDTFTGVDTCTYTIEDPSGAASTGTVVVTVTDAAAGGAYDFLHAFPWLPASDNDIVIWPVPAGGGVNSDVGAITKLLVCVVPANFTMTRQIAVTGPNKVGTLYRGVVIVGGEALRQGTFYSIPKDAVVSADYPDGFPGGQCIEVRFKETGWGAVRPFFWISNFLLRMVNSSGVRKSWWGDIMRIGTKSSNGSNHANFCDIYIQKFSMPDGHWGWTQVTGKEKDPAQAAKPHADFDNQNQPHTDVLQSEGGVGINNIYMSEVIWATGYQGLFISPIDNLPGPPDPYVGPTSVCRIDNTHFKVLPQRTVDPKILNQRRVHILIFPGIPTATQPFMECVVSKVARDAAPTTYTSSVYMETLTGAAPGADEGIQGATWTYGNGILTAIALVKSGRYPFSDGSAGNAKFNVSAPATPPVNAAHMGDDLRPATANDATSKAAFRAAMT